MATFAFRFEWLPVAILMAFCASNFLVDLVQGEAGDLVMVEAQVIPFPALHPMTLEALIPQNPFVRVVLLMTCPALIIRFTGFLQRPDPHAIVAVAALGGQMFAAEVLLPDPAVEYVFKARDFLRPGGESVARRAV